MPVAPHKVKLDYVFRCRFKDGTWLMQTPDDVPVHASTGSAFTDVANRIDDVERFSITNGRTMLTVDLTDGSFEMNGVRFCVGEGNGSYRLVYFRRRQETFPPPPEGTPQYCEYHVGWESGGQTVTVALQGKLQLVAAAS